MAPAPPESPPSLGKPAPSVHAAHDNPWPPGHGVRDHNRDTFTPGHPITGGGNAAPIVPFAVHLVRCASCGYATDSAASNAEDALAEVRRSHRCRAPDLTATPYRTEGL